MDYNLVENLSGEEIQTAMGDGGNIPF